MTSSENQTLPNLTANDGLVLPAIGFGTYKLRGFDGSTAIESALNNGYRLLDSAVNYDNEGTVGKAIHQSGVPREDIIVTSKLPGRYHNHDQAVETIEESLLRMDLDYIDLYLIHWPNPIENQYVEAWQTLIELKDRGLIKHIGVSNFLPEHIDRLVKETGVTPAVNQIQLHPYWQQQDLKAYDDKHGIITEAWSPLRRGGETVKDPTIVSVAQKHGVTPTQVVLRWHVDYGDIPIPKSATPSRQIENLDVMSFDFDDEDRAAFAGLDSPDGSRGDFDPRSHQEM
ncbi:aldo/keto reductase [Bifidobacterium sp.]|jgi:diketogulonate reductase-like aldo/keto reductase|uniref:aldo/keto reductase n=1 Tax=Bifidobacterium sp. TaxID=41200 RepID=UPI0025C27150|nr:aldo/keto reductase [Bifidobacterium sp.]MCI1634958.1 aldo/keto reductase [Bifidobacterium sp.]